MPEGHYKKNELLRWVGFLPAAIVVAAIASFPLHWLVLLVTSSYLRQLGLRTLTLQPEILERFGMAFLMPFVVLSVSGRVVPRHKMPIVGILAGLWLVGVVVLYILLAERMLGGALENVVALAMTVAGVGAGMYYAYVKAQGDL